MNSESCCKGGLRILGTGCFKPEKIVKNSDFSEFIETDDEWIKTRTGISERRFHEGRNYLMAASAAKNALNSANISPEEIDVILVSTASPDFFYPSCSCLVQRLIGAKNACALDVSAACSGFIYALDIARNYLTIGKYKKILVIASECLSQQINFEDRSSCVLFGDGAGAVIVEASENSVFASFLGASGEDAENETNLFCEVDYSRNCPFVSTKTSERPKSPHIQMNGKEIYKFAVDIMAKATLEACASAGFELSELDLLIPHQANIRIISAAAKNLRLPMEKVYVNIANTGNVSSACIPTCLDELNRAGKLKNGMKICATAFGAGLTYGSIAFTVNS